MMLLTTVTAGAVDITQNTAVVINSSNKGTYNNKSIGGTIPSGSSAGSYTTFYSPAGVTIDGIELNLTIDGLNMDYSGMYSTRSGIALRNGATLHLTVNGTNTLKAGFGGAGIAVPDGCTLEITSASTGTLNAIGGKSNGGGAGIGSIGDGNNTNRVMGDLTPQGLGDIIINGGTINAQGGTWYQYYNPGGGAAGIGSSEFNGASVTDVTFADNRYINNITGSITINGGTVNATGGVSAAGIGGGSNGTLKTITITGGTVTAAGNSGGASIGLGYNAFTSGSGSLTCPEISLTGGTITSDGNIGYGKEAVASQNIGGTVVLGENVLKCTGSIMPSPTFASSSYVSADRILRNASDVSPILDKDEWTSGWWVVDEYTEINSRIYVTGTVNLILKDGVTLKANKGIQVYKGNTLNIYGQVNGTGKIIATAGQNYNAGIGGGYVEGRSSHFKLDKSCGTINIYGGIIEASGGKEAAGIGCGQIHQETTDGGTVSIYGGTVTATGGGDGGAGIGSGRSVNTSKFKNPHTVNIYGGTVNATSRRSAAGIGGGWSAPGGNITITGGTVTAKGGEDSAGIGHGEDGWGGTITLGWTNMTDAIYANGYSGDVTLDKSFVLQGGAVEATTENIGGQTIVPPVSVTFNANGGSGTMGSVKVAYRGSYTLPDCGFTLSGKDFDKWQVGDLEVEVGGSIEMTADTEIKALWKQSRRTVTFNLNGHGDGDAPESQTVDYGAKLTDPAAPTASGYTFGGWYKESTCVNRWEFASETVTENRTLYAKWTVDAYTISYVLDGGVNSANNPLSYTTEETITLSDPTKTGYTFAGWTPDNGVISKGSTGNKTFTAIWTVNRYTITFDTDGGSTVESATYDYGAAVSAPDVTPTCHERIFLVWQNLPSTMPAEDITVDAQWRWLYHYEAREATCMYEGMIDCYYGNGHYYTENPDGVTYTEILRSDVTTPKTSHNYDNPEWTWSIDNYSGEWRANLKLTCTKDASHVLQTFAEVTSEVTTAPTLTTEGVKTYTATVKVDKESSNTTETKTYTNTKEVILPKAVIIAKIGEQGYPSVKAAMDDAVSDDVITVMEDVNEPETTCGDVPSLNNNFTLDLNGHSVTLASITMSESLTVKNGTLRCIINNANVGNKDALTLDNAEVHCEEISKYNEYNELVPYHGLDWSAKNIAVTNGSMLYIIGGTYLGGGAEDGFNLTIDGTSCVVLKEATLSGYNDARVRSQFAQYLPTGYSINTDYEDNIPDGRVMYGGVECDDPVTLSPATITLADNADNSTVIDFNDGYEKNVQLEGRTLYKDGSWNTLCLPFNVTIAGSPLDGDDVDVRTLSSSDFSDGTLTLTFTDAGAVTTIEAGKPYIIRWNNTGANLTESDLVFEGVTVNSTFADVTTDWVDFRGTLSPEVIYESADEKHNLYLGSDNTLYYPSVEGFRVKSCRGWFQLKNGLTCGTPAGVRAFNLSFGDEETGISLTPDPSRGGEGSLYTLSGVKLDGKPTKKGVYILRSADGCLQGKNGKKVVIK